MILKAGLALFLLLDLRPASSRLLCGIDPVAGTFFEMHIKLDCRKFLKQHQKCCTDHGVCYIFRKPYTECDQEYCDCVYQISGKSGDVCQTHGENFCKVVKETGKNYYNMYQKR